MLIESIDTILTVFYKRSFDMKKKSVLAIMMVLVLCFASAGCSILGIGGKKKKVSLLRKKSLVSLMWSTLMTLKQSNSSRMSIPRIFPGMGIPTYRCRRSPARQIPNMTIN